ncbi:MAG TPA: glycoside hydrolase family 2 TIM barrel-domain containing protein, partial [Spirochaetia bacterium]|nr:glycoside hydrolase family 2 TIM barrel-domain containing protein [Spirochaetia bacterium]
FGQTIVVPFAYQAPLSGIGDQAVHEIVWYRKSFTLPPSFSGRRAVLRFGAVDWACDVWVNGRHAVFHEGGYTPFQADISPFLTTGEQTVVVRVVDHDDAAQPRGKQSWRGERFGCWYTANTGIWQSVWVEAVGAVALKAIQIDADAGRRQATIEVALDRPGSDLELEAAVSFEGKPFRTLRATLTDRTPRLTVDLDWPDQLDLHYLWRPGNPKLFDVVLTLRRQGTDLDRVETYFGVRKIESHHGQVFLNNVPLVQNLILDQGYWPDGLLTPPSDEAIKRDIELAMSFGFNGARKHQKFEDPRFYYWADKLGFLVWGEMPSSYRFQSQAIAQTTAQWQEFIARDRNHPSIVAWVPINESWGVYNILSDKKMQDYSRALYTLTKSLDNTRLVSSNDGWEQVETDLCAIHDYEASGERFARKAAPKQEMLATKIDWRSIYAVGSEHRGEPILLTEWGGIAFQGGDEGAWGYAGRVKNEEEFLERFASMLRAMRNAGYFVGHCYTQLTDVQQEINGLLTPDRKP